MELASNTVLVTGGASGIGLALAERFIRAGSKVLVCGRREERLRELAETHPGVVTRVCDVARDDAQLTVLVAGVEATQRQNLPALQEEDVDRDREPLGHA